MELNNLINEYFNITGRPISTMTVDEYLKFVNSAVSINTENTVLQSNSGNIDTNNTYIKPEINQTVEDNIIELPKDVQKKKNESERKTTVNNQPKGNLDISFLKSFGG